MTPTPGAAAPGPPTPATLAVGGVGTLDAESGSDTDGAAVAGELAGLLGAAAGLVAAARAANTRTAYGSDWARFAGWCAQRDLAALPATPATLGAYLTAAVTDPAGPAYVPATLARWVAAVNFTHRQAGQDRPQVGGDQGVPAGDPGRPAHRR